MALTKAEPTYKAPKQRFVPVVINNKLVFRFDPERGLIEWQSRGEKHIIDLAEYAEKQSSGNSGVTIDVGSQLARRIHERGGTTSIPSLQEGRSGWMHVGGARNVFVPARPVLALGDQSEQRLTRIIEFVIDQIERQFGR